MYCLFNLTILNCCNKLGNTFSVQPLLRWQPLEISKLVKSLYLQNVEQMSQTFVLAILFNFVCFLQYAVDHMKILLFGRETRPQLTMLVLIWIHFGLSTQLHIFLLQIKVCFFYKWRKQVKYGMYSRLGHEGYFSLYLLFILLLCGFILWHIEVLISCCFFT